MRENVKPSCYMMLCFVLATACGCQPVAPITRKPAGPPLLNGTQRILEVDRSCKNPHRLRNQDDVQESYYTKDAQGTIYDVTFSADGSAVKIVSGSNTVESVGWIDNGKVRTYGLKTFAGGRLVVWPTGTNYEAELTIFGSGFPIISSERGVLIEKEWSNN